MPQTAAIANAFGSVTKAGAQYSSGQYNAAVARNNQSIANSNADLAVFKGQRESQISEERTAQTIGAERAGYGANGVLVNSPTAMRTQADTARIGAMDAQTIQQNAQRSAWGYKMQGQTYGEQAQLDQQEGTFGAMSSLIGGGSNFADKWNIFKNTGVVNPNPGP